LRDIVDNIAYADGFETEEHCIGLLRDLEIKGLIKGKQAKRRRGEKFALRHLCRILGLGISLQNESIPRDPDIDDGRV
jgi:hypothetical protein